MKFSKEFDEILNLAKDSARGCGLESISLESIQRYIVERYLDGKGEDSVLQKLFNKKVNEETKELLRNIVSKAVADVELGITKSWTSYPKFSKEVERILKRVEEVNSITYSKLFSDYEPKDISTSTFYVAMFFETTLISEKLKSLGLGSNDYMDLKISMLEDKFVEAGFDKGFEMLDMMKESREREDKRGDEDEADDEEAKFEKAGDKSAIRTRKPKENSSTPTIDSFGVDMTENAKDGKYDPVIGRDKEVSQIIEILCCRKKRNAMILGEAGTGKSAVVEGLAQKIVSGDVPLALKNKKIVSISTTDLTAGTQYRGQLEERVMNLCQELKENQDIIIYIDEVHQSSSDNSTSIADMLKPSLGRGEITLIASTTLDEYKKYLEKDAAFKRRFQKVMISEPNKEETYKILKGLVKKYQEFHQVRYSDEVLKLCCEYCERYMYDRKSPDRAIDLLDTAGAATRLANPVDTAVLDKLEKEKEVAVKKKIKAIDKSDFSEAKIQKDEESRLENEIAELKKKMTSSDPKSWPEVTIETVASVISKISGVAVDKIVTPEMDKIRAMGSELKKVVIGQDEAIDSIVKALSKSFLGLRNENRPVASFLLTGSSGCGKTLIAEKVAETVYGKKESLIRIDGGELTEPGSITKLIGASASYVGYNDTALLDKVRDTGQCTILIDECEKIFAGTMNSLFLNILDTGRCKLANGKEVDFRNCIIIMTSNQGTKELELKGNGIGFGEPSKEAKRSSDVSTVMKSLEKQFRPEFRARLTDIIIFNSLGEPEMMKIFDLELAKFKERLKKKGYSLTVGKELKKYIVSKTDTRYGARDLIKGIGTYIEDKIVEKLLDPATDLTKKKIEANLVGEKVEITLK